MNTAIFCDICQQPVPCVDPSFRCGAGDCQECNAIHPHECGHLCHDFNNVDLMEPIKAARPSAVDGLDDTASAEDLFLAMASDEIAEGHLLSDPDEVCRSCPDPPHEGQCAQVNITPGGVTRCPCTVRPGEGGGSAVTNAVAPQTHATEETAADLSAVVSGSVVDKASPQTGIEIQGGSVKAQLFFHKAWGILAIQALGEDHAVTLTFKDQAHILEALSRFRRAP